LLGVGASGVEVGEQGGRQCSLGQDGKHFLPQGIWVIGSNSRTEKAGLSPGRRGSVAKQGEDDERHGAIGNRRCHQPACRTDAGEQVQNLSLIGGVQSWKVTAASSKFSIGQSVEQVVPDSRARLRKGRLGYLSDAESQARHVPAKRAGNRQSTSMS
jgi:hypothetical protein